MAAQREFAGDLVGDAGFERKRAGGRPPCAAHEPARCLDRLLHVVAEVHHPRDQRRLGLGLSFAAHCSVGEDRFPVFQHHCRDDGMERALARLEPIGMAIVE